MDHSPTPSVPALGSLLGVYELGEVGGLPSWPLPSTAMHETALAACFRIVYWQRRKGDREGDEP